MTWLPPAIRRCKFSGVSDASTRPSNMISTRPHIISTSGKMCVEINTVCLPARLLIKRAHRADLLRVEADGRLVQNDQFRLMHQRIRQADALAVALGKLADDAAAHVRQAALFHHRGDALA